MKYKLIILLIGCLLWGCMSKSSAKNELKLKIEGTWQLLSAEKIVNKDTTYTKYSGGVYGVKIINENHFAFFQHDLNKGKDSTTAKFSSGGGKYILKGDHYTEFLEYCSARKWEGNTFDFIINVKNDSLIQTGIEKIPELGVERKIIETYIRIDNKN